MFKILKGVFPISILNKKIKGINIFFILIVLFISMFVSMGFSAIQETSLYAEEEKNISNSRLNSSIIMLSSNDTIEENQVNIVKGFIPKVYADAFMNYGNGAVVEIVNNVPLKTLSEYYLNQTKKLDIDTNNLVFIGNSLVEGLKIGSKGQNNFICKVGISLDGLKSGYYNKLYNYSCETVVIGMGTNELGYYDETRFKNSYMDLVNHIRSINPDSNIICLSIPPVTQNKSNSSAYFNNSNVKKYSQYIQELCAENNLIYLDNTPFFGEVLSSKWSGDGIHMGGSVYREWYQFVIEKISEL